MGGPSSHLAADHSQTVAINASDKSMPAPTGGGPVGGKRRRGFDPNESTLNGDYRRPRRRPRKRWLMGVARCPRFVLVSRFHGVPRCLFAYAPLARHPLARCTTSPRIPEDTSTTKAS